MWQDTIQETFEFKDFSQALNFVNTVGELAEKSDHHPTITMHDYKKVTITLTTHSEGKVTEKDHNLAKQIEDKYNGKMQ